MPLEPGCTFSARTAGTALRHTHTDTPALGLAECPPQARSLPGLSHRPWAPPLHTRPEGPLDLSRPSAHLEFHRTPPESTSCTPGAPNTPPGPPPCARHGRGVEAQGHREGARSREHSAPAPSRPGELSPCRINNEGCQDLCLLTHQGHVNCSCRGGRILQEDLTCRGETLVACWGPLGTGSSQTPTAQPGNLSLRSRGWPRFLAGRGAGVLGARVPRALAHGAPSPSPAVNSSCRAQDEFECANGECIDFSLTCDGVSHCKDKSDEKPSYCSKEPPPRDPGLHQQPQPRRVGRGSEGSRRRPRSSVSSRWVRSRRCSVSKEQTRAVPSDGDAAPPRERLLTVARSPARRLSPLQEDLSPVQQWALCFQHAVVQRGGRLRGWFR